MNKLIELLNEHELEKAKEIGIIVYKWEAHGGILFAIPTRPMNISALSILETRAVLVNKEYGFIKRLVENDKIDRGKIEERISGDVSLYLDNREYYGRYKWLLMLLSIQDNPIEFLVSILK